MASTSSTQDLCPTCRHPLRPDHSCLRCAMDEALQAAAEDPEAGADLPEAEAGFAAFSDPLLPMEIGRFRLLARLGNGGMGTVYEAEDLSLGRTVALKLIRGYRFSTAEEKGRFQREAQAAARLDHPDIVPVYEVGELEGCPFLASKLIRGGTLADRLQAGRMKAEEAAAIMAKVADAVGHAHEKGVLHRDLKPSNILIDGTGKPWLTDFGMARMEGGGAALTVTGEQIGTPCYMSPEQAAGKVRGITAASDIWALGTILYEMLSGCRPYEGESNIAIMHHVVSAPAPVFRAASVRERDLAVLIGCCLQKEPGRRLPGAGLLAEELGRWLRGEPIRSRPAVPAERCWLWLKRHPVAVILIALLMAAGIFAVSKVTHERGFRGEASLTPPQGVTGAFFGRAVALEGETLVVGAPKQGGGAVYVYGRIRDQWMQQGTLTPPGSGAMDDFGRAVALHGDTIVVGSPGGDSTVSGSGVAHVFRRGETGWKHQARLVAETPQKAAAFGRCVEISGSTIVVGAHLEDGDGRRNSGAAYIFTEKGSSWRQEARLTAPQLAQYALFGIGVCVDGDTVIAGADGVATAYVFTRSNGAWTLQTRLAPPKPGADCFGYAVALSGNTALIGAYRENSSSSGVGSIPDSAAKESGAAFVFVREGGTWRMQAYLKPHNPQEGSRFGFQVALQGSRAVIGSYAESSGTTGMNGTAGGRFHEAGAAYVFERQASTWAQQSYLKPSLRLPLDHFGIALGLDGDRLVVGAPGSDVPPYGNGKAWTFQLH